MNNMPRLKSTLLTQVDNKWYYQGMPFTGVIFFDKEDSQIAPFIVHNGAITEPYISPCIENPPAIMQIEGSAIHSPDCHYDQIQDCWDDVRLCYQDKLYEGMVYDFTEGKCLYENYIYDDGFSGNSVNWNTENLLPVSFMLNYIPDKLLYNYSGYKRDEIFYSYSNWRYDKQIEKVAIAWNPITKKVKEFTATKSVLQDKPYTSCPIPLPEVYEMIDSYQTYIFDKFTRLNISEETINELFDIWLRNDSFRYIETLQFHNLAGLKDLGIFNNKKIFSSLKEIRLYKSDLPETVAKLKAIVPDINVVHNKRI